MSSIDDGCTVVASYAGVTLSGRFVAPSALGIARVHTEGASSAYIRRVQVTKSPDQIMNPMLLPNGEGTFAHQGVAAGAHGGSGGVLAGDWQLHSNPKHFVPFLVIMRK